MTPPKCKNGLHEIDPNDPWRSSNGARCRECYLARNARYNNSLKGSDRAWKWYCNLTLQQRFDRYMQQRRKRTAENQAIRRAAGFVPNSAVVAELDKLLHRVAA
jgi:hypothetical protein